MTETEQRIFESLVELDDLSRRMPQLNPKPNLLPLFARIDELAGQLPPATHGELVHYIKRKSYEKARRWLEGKGAENARGGCGH